MAARVGRAAADADGAHSTGFRHPAGPQGVVTVETDEGTRVVPSHRAVWIPAGVGHSIAMSGWVSMRTLYLLPRLVAALPNRCCVVAVSPLLGHLIMHAIGRGALRRAVPEQRRLAIFLVDQLRALPAVPLELPLARDAGASRRTFERLFHCETGMSFGRWRRQARLLHALRLLARDEAVTAIALEVGYESVSSVHHRLRERARHDAGPLLSPY